MNFDTERAMRPQHCAELHLFIMRIVIVYRCMAETAGRLVPGSITDCHISKLIGPGIDPHVRPKRPPMPGRKAISRPGGAVVAARKRLSPLAGRRAEGPRRITQIDHIASRRRITYQQPLQCGCDDHRPVTGIVQHHLVDEIKSMTPIGQPTQIAHKQRRRRIDPLRSGRGPRGMARAPEQQMPKLCHQRDARQQHDPAEKGGRTVEHARCRHQKIAQGCAARLFVLVAQPLFPNAWMVRSNRPDAARPHNPLARVHRQ